MFQLIFRLVEAVQPFIVPVCLVCAWIFVAMLFLTLKNAVSAVADRAKQMHQIPCTNCQFFNNDYRLKCSVNPHIANTENAIDCCDYRDRSR
jgi:hypothetical protein